MPTGNEIERPGANGPHVTDPMARWVWNKMIETNNKQYEQNKTFVFYNEMAGMLPGLKKDYEWLRESNSQTLQTITKSLETTLKQFIKNPKANGFPKFKNKRNSSQSFVVPQHFTIDNKHFTIPKIGKISVVSRFVNLELAST